MDYGQIVSGGLGLIGSALNYKYQQKLAEQQNQYNIDMWKMQADYNSPQAQMQRFKDAGLNPNLIYGQGSNGNMSSAPQMVTPNAPELSRSMEKVAEMFNIENLRTIIANRKKTEADAKKAGYEARSSFTDMRRNEDNYDADIALGENYSFDPKTGGYVFAPRNGFEKEIYGASRGYLNNKLENNVIRRYLLDAREENIRANSGLIPYRASFLTAQRNFLAPQIRMAEFEQKHQPVTYWVGTGTKVLNSLTSLPNTFSPIKWGYHPSNY